MTEAPRRWAPVPGALLVALLALSACAPEPDEEAEVRRATIEVLVDGGFPPALAECMVEEAPRIAGEPITALRDDPDTYIDTWIQAGIACGDGD